MIESYNPERKLNMNRIIILIVSFSLTNLYSFAQDTTKKQSVEITSAFKPVLKNAVKLKFNATPPAPDNSNPNLNYNIPIQNLYFNLQPVSIKPLALLIDSAGEAHNSNYIKAGFGSNSTPLIDAGFSFGDGKKTNITLLANHLSQKGSLRAQKFSNTGLSANLNTVVKKMELYGKVGYQQQTYYLYGPDPSTANAKIDSLKKPYQTVNIRAGLRNATISPYGVSYNPDLNINVFNDSRSSETNAELNVPVEVRFGSSFGSLLRVNADLTTFKPADSAKAYSNNIFFLNAAAFLKTSRVYVKAGIRPTWDNSKVHVLPDVLVDIHLQEKKVILTAGWSGYVRKNTYQYLVSQNPWINQPGSQFNTRITELYGGLKGTLLNSFNYRAQTGYIEYLNLPLFSNHIKPSVFTVLQEGKLQGLHTQGEIGYVLQDKFTASAKADIYSFFGQQNYSGAYHVIPVQLTASLRWQPVKRIIVSSDLFSWQGPLYETTTVTNRLPSVFDLNAGLEFKAHKYISIWTQFNNVFNNTYERWKNYETIGFNFVAGIRLTFDQKQQ